MSRKIWLVDGWFLVNILNECCRGKGVRVEGSLLVLLLMLLLKISSNVNVELKSRLVKEIESVPYVVMGGEVLWYSAVDDNSVSATP